MLAALLSFFLHLTDSKFLRDTEWLMKSFEEGTRTQSVLITAPDVLEPRILKKVSKSIREFYANRNPHFVRRISRAHVQSKHLE